MSSGNATVISPMITKQIIKQEINLDLVKEEDDKCILYISSSANNSNSLTLSCSSEESLDVKNGHNYTSATKDSNQNTSSSASSSSLQRDRLNTTVTTTANRSIVKRIDYSKTTTTATTSTTAATEYQHPSASLEHTPSSSPLSFNESHPQDMFCSSTVSGDCSSNACLDTSDIKVRDTSPKRLCLVCGDTASGFHYGVASCEACKAFFKRTIQGNIEYTCPATNNCEINKRRRKACQACRFQKCLRMGMLKEGVRLDRVRGGRQKYRRTSEAPYHTQNFTLKKSSLEDNRIVAALINCEPEPMLSNANAQMSSPNSNGSLSSVSSTQYKNLCILSDLVDKELVATIGWAKQIPGFSDLTLNDQMRLLQSTWAEILALSLAFRSHQYSSPPNTPASLSPNNASSTTNPIFNKLVFATDFIIDEQAAAQCNAEEFFAHMIQLIKRLHQIKIAKEEYLLLKAIILSNADISLEGFDRVSKLRETLIHSLQECVSILRPQSVVNHLSQLFLCLPLLRELDSVTRRLWLNVLQEGSVPMNKLFIEMLETSF
ncbi:hypothetical protein RDWZM_009460 [Blomia tropicalis]|uniref:Estrogen-related receptor n=1 Tax=Blomia tropicalis TaxID=40697 RepID=A0A9Q0RJR2_BLOTA|nr:hypothetical protein RDWZM_009460 [Blomia tropicalis]